MPKVKSLIDGLYTSAGKLAKGDEADLPADEIKAIEALDGPKRIEKAKKRASK